MTIQDVTINVKDGSSGLGRSNARKTVAVIGVVSTGTANTVYAHASKAKLIADHVGGPAVEAAAHILDQAGGTVLLVPVTASVAGTIGTVASAGTTPPVLTPSGSPTDARTIKVRIVTAGALGTSAFQYSKDGGLSWSSIITTAATYAIGGTGVTLGFAAGTYAADNTYSFDTVAPYYSTTNLNSAFAALLADARRFRFVYVVGQAGGVTDTARCDAQASMAAAVSSQLASAATAKRWTRALLDTPRPVADDSAGETAWMAALKASTAFGTFADARVLPVAGDVTMVSAVSNLVERRPLGFSAAAREAKVDLSVDISAYSESESGALPAAVRSIYHDERVAPGLDAGRFVTSRTFPGADSVGFYFTDTPSMALSTSDYAGWPTCFVVDEACHVAYAAMLQFLSRRLQADGTTGYILEREARAAEQFVGSKLRAGIIQKGDATAASIVINRADDLRVAPATLKWQIRLVTWIYPKGIEVDMGVTLPSVATV